MEMNLILKSKNSHISLTVFEKETVDLIYEYIYLNQINRHDIKFEFIMKDRNATVKSFRLYGIEYLCEEQFVESVNSNLTSNGRWDAAKFKLYNTEKIFYNVHLF